MARMTYGVTTPVAIVDGFPVTNDGSLVYDEGKGSYVLDMGHMVQLVQSIGICIDKVDFDGTIVDDRTKKSGKSFAKDKLFVEENPGLCDFGDLRAVAELLRVVQKHGHFLKCDVNFNSHHESREEIDPSSKKTRLIFVFGLPGNSLGIQKDVYVKFDFTKTRRGIRFHLDSLHYGYGIAF